MRLPLAVPYGRICLVTAARIEFQYALKVLPQPSTGREFGIPVSRAWLPLTNGNERAVTVLHAEIGAVDFLTSLQRHLRIFPYDALLVCGLAGALSPQLRAGTVALYERCLDARTFPNLPQGNDTRSNNLPEIACDPTLHGWAMANLQQADIQSVATTGITTSAVLTKSPQKRALAQQLQRPVRRQNVIEATIQNAVPMAIDMESYAVMRVAQECAIPTMALRVIADQFADHLPEFSRGRSADDSVRFRQMLRVMAAEPYAAGRFLWRLRRALNTYRCALRGLLWTHQTSSGLTM